MNRHASDFPRKVRKIIGQRKEKLLTEILARVVLVYSVIINNDHVSDCRLEQQELVAKEECSDGRINQTQSMTGRTD
jgi:hypothetical protein